MLTARRTSGCTCHPGQVFITARAPGRNPSFARRTWSLEFCQGDTLMQESTGGAELSADRAHAEPADGVSAETIAAMQVCSHDHTAD
jgi:hypothetical protein